jgi:hypothetical protein
VLCLGFFGVFFEMVRRWLHLEVIIKASLPYPCSIVVRQALAEGARSRVLVRSPRIESVFVFIGMVSCQSLSIYDDR